MGVDTRIVVYAESQKIAEDACSAAFERIAALDSIMSDYRVDSELTRLSNQAGGPPVAISPELFRVLQISEKFSLESKGMFDVTVGPLVKLWRKARKAKSLPTNQEIADARKLVGWQKLKLDAAHRTAQLLQKGMRLDLGAIGKGYADDEAQIVLKSFGIKNALVEMGGDIVVTNPPPGKKGWTIRVLNAENKGKEADMEFSNCAISTSGDTEQYFELNGKHYSHVVNPITGIALTGRVEATIIAKDGMTADPLSTALTLLGPEDRLNLLKRYPGTKSYVRINTRASD